MTGDGVEGWNGSYGKATDKAIEREKAAMAGGEQESSTPQLTGLCRVVGHLLPGRL